METGFMNRIIGLVIALVVGGLLVGGLLIPSIEGMTATEKTYTNEGYFRMSEITDASADTTITWEYTKPLIFNINGVDFTMPSTQTTGDVFPYTIFATDGWGVRLSSYSNRVDLNLYGSSNASLLWYATTADNDSVTITFSEGTASFSKNGNTAVTQSYTKVFLPDAAGDYTLKKGSNPAFMLEDSVIYSTGRTSSTFNGTGVTYNVHLEGNIGDGATATVIAPTGYTTSDIEIVYAEVAEGVGLYSFDKVTFTVTDSSSNTADVTYAQVIVPYQVTTELTHHMDATQIAMFGVISILGIVALVVVAANGIRNKY